MADTLTYLDQLIDDVKGLGYKITVTIGAAAATATTSSEIVGGLGSSESTDVFNNRGLWIPSAAAAADQFRVIAVAGYAFTATASVTTFTFTNTSNFGEALTATGYILAAGLTPDDIIALLNDSLEEVFTEAYEPVKSFGDSLQGSAVDTDWTESNATDTVSTTAANLGAYGQQVFDVLDGGAGTGYTQMALSRLPQGSRGRLHGLVQSITGTSAVKLIDGSGNEQASISTTQAAEVYLGKDVTFDSTDEQARIRLAGTTASAEGYWTSAWFTRSDQTQFRLPSYIDGRFKVSDVVRRVYHDNGTEADTWLADSFSDIPLKYNDDYTFDYRGADGNASHITFTVQGKQYLSEPLFVIVSCPYSAPYGKSSVFATYASTNPCPVRLLVPMAQYLLGQRWADAFPEEEAKGLKRIAQRVIPRKNEGDPMPERIVIHRVRN